MDFLECMMGRRSCRRFKQDPVPREDLERMIDVARYVPTGYNKHGLRFAIVSSPEKVAEMFEFTGWLTGKPAEGQRPTAYIVTMLDTEVGGGIAAAYCATYAVMLTAHSLGYGSCWHGCHGSDKVRTFLGVPENIELAVTVSLGKSDETVVVHDPSDDWEVKKLDDGTVHLGKPSRETVTIAVL